MVGVYRLADDGDLRKRVAELKAENDGLRDANMAMCMRVRDLEADYRDLTETPENQRALSMDDLLSSKDILSEPRVVAAWHGLLGQTGHVQHTRRHFDKHGNPDYPNIACEKCGREYRYGIDTGKFYEDTCPVPDPINVSVYEAAFRMQAAVDLADLDYPKYLRLIFEHDWPEGAKCACWEECYTEWLEYKITAKHRIVAATLAWEGDKFD